MVAAWRSNPEAEQKDPGTVHIRYGYAIEIRCEDVSEILVRLDVHPLHRAEITEPDELKVVALASNTVLAAPPFEVDRYRTIVRRIALPPGGVMLEAEGMAHQSGFAEHAYGVARPVPASALPDDVRAFLDVGSSPGIEASSLAGRLRDCAQDDCAAAVREVLGHVRTSVRLVSGGIDCGRMADRTFHERVGTASDLVQLAVVLCRTAGMPARICSGYRCAAGRHVAPTPGHWFEVYFDGRWWPFDAEALPPAIGRLPISIGRDAEDVAAVRAGPRPIGYQGRFFAEEVAGARFPLTSLQRRQHWDRQPDRPAADE